MIKQILIVAVLVLLFNALFVFTGGLEMLMQTKQAVSLEDTSIGTDVVDVFQFTLEDEVRKKIGKPENGFEPYMFLQVFPGLAETDFDGVEASVGRYYIVDGTLQYQTGVTKLVHNAAKSIERTGMQTLLENVAKRIGIDLTTNGTITDIMRSITSQGR